MMKVRVKGIFIGESEVPYPFDIQVEVGGEPETQPWHLALIDAARANLEPNLAFAAFESPPTEYVRTSGFLDFRYSY